MTYPDYRDPRDRKVMIAVGWKGESVYGLFADDALSAGNPLFREICRLLVDNVSCAASYDGHELLVASSVGWIFSVDTASGNLTAMRLAGRTPSDFGVVSRLVATRDHGAFAALTASDGPSPRIASRVGANDWAFIVDPPADPLPSPEAFGIDVDDSDPGKPPLLLVATNTKVRAITSPYHAWTDVSNGLPTTPFCSDLRFNRFKRRWSLGTYGRSVWQAGALVQVGVSSLLRSDYPMDADHYNFEALVLIGDKLFPYTKDNSDPGNRWVRTQTGPITDGVTAPACIVRSDFVTGADHFNFEALILRKNELTHWYRDNSENPREWQFAEVVDVAQYVPGGATGPASMAVSDYQSDGHGNFEALIPTGSGLFHFWRNHATGKWQPATMKPVTPNPGSCGCIITTDYYDGEHRGLEALVFEPHDNGIGVLSHFKWHPADSEWKWTANIADTACGPACLIQSDYEKGADHGNLEALVPLAIGGVNVLRHFWRRDAFNPNADWVSEETFVSTRLQSTASMLQSDFFIDEDHGNFETLFVEVDNELWHVARDQSTSKWFYVGSVI